MDRKGVTPTPPAIMMWRVAVADSGKVAAGHGGGDVIPQRHDIVQPDATPARGGFALDGDLPPVGARRVAAKAVGAGADAGDVQVEMGARLRARQFVAVRVLQGQAAQARARQGWRR